MWTGGSMHRARFRIARAHESEYGPSVCVQLTFRANHFNYCAAALTRRERLRLRRRVGGTIIPPLWPFFSHTITYQTGVRAFTSLRYTAAAFDRK